MTTTANRTSTQSKLTGKFCNQLEGKSTAGTATKDKQIINIQKLDYDSSLLSNDEISESMIDKGLMGESGCSPNCSRPHGPGKRQSQIEKEASSAQPGPSQNQQFRVPDLPAKRKKVGDSDSQSKRVRDENGSLSTYMKDYDLGRRYKGMEKPQIEQKKQ